MPCGCPERERRSAQEPPHLQPFTEVDEDEAGTYDDDSAGEEDSEEEGATPGPLPFFFTSGAGSRSRGRGSARGAAGVGVGLAPVLAGRVGAAGGAEQPASDSDSDAEEDGASPDLALLMHELGMAVLNSKGGAPSDEWGVGPGGCCAVLGCTGPVAARRPLDLLSGFRPGIWGSRWR